MHVKRNKNEAKMKKEQKRAGIPKAKMDYDAVVVVVVVADAAVVEVVVVAVVVVGVVTS